MDPMSATDDPTASAGWRLIVPVKGAPDAKSRLRVEPAGARIHLARAMAEDTIDAALATPSVSSVLVVTSDEAVAGAARAAGATVVPDPGRGLNDAIRHGRDTLAAEGPGPVAALLADLPALRPADLELALAACAHHPSAYVPDAEGVGTVLLTALRPSLLEPAFGTGSARRHDLLAHREELDLPALRRDVDLADSLVAVRAMGVGPRTSAVLDHGARAVGHSTVWLR
jgi:2-phospho-L-lactate/phosphoenolpyruvate guanylyltransferase